MKLYIVTLSYNKGIVVSIILISFILSSLFYILPILFVIFNKKNYSHRVKVKLDYNVGRNIKDHHI